MKEEMLRELHRLHDAAGPEMQGAIAAQIAALQASGVSLAGTAQAAANTAQQMRDLGLTVTEIPGNKTIFIDAPTAEQKKRLDDLGLRVMTLPNGKIFVTADTSPAEGTIEAFMNRRRSIQIAVSASPLASGVRGHTAATGGEVVPWGIRRDIGGPVYGPGGPTDDLVRAFGPGGLPYRLSNGEHILTAAEVRAAGGHGAIRELRRDLLAGGAGPVAAAAAQSAASPQTVINDNRTVNAYAMDERRLVRLMREQQRDEQFLAGIR